ncbi:MAG: J domain-containing protein [Chitinophagales bacterium]|nr:J domain-containing protein [Chitinophagales bacterium]MCB9312604.1 J domain-containing protein [Lewinellaceae bacterium]
MKSKDYHYILGLSPDASKDQIKQAYKKLSIKFHPDKNQGDPFFEDRFKEIQEAYDALMNEQLPHEEQNKDGRDSSKGFHSDFPPSIEYFAVDKKVLQIGEHLHIRWKVFHADRVQISCLEGFQANIGNASVDTASALTDRYTNIDLIATNTYSGTQDTRRIQIEILGVENEAEPTTGHAGLDQDKAAENGSQASKKKPGSTRNKGIDQSSGSPRKSSRRWRILVPALLILVLAGAGVVWWLTPQELPFKEEMTSDSTVETVDPVEDNTGLDLEIADLTRSWIKEHNGAYNSGLANYYTASVDLDGEWTSRPEVLEIKKQLAALLDIPMTASQKPFVTRLDEASYKSQLIWQMWIHGRLIKSPFHIIWSRQGDTWRIREENSLVPYRQILEAALAVSDADPASLQTSDEPPLTRESSHSEPMEDPSATREPATPPPGSQRNVVSSGGNATAEKVESISTPTSQIPPYGHRNRIAVQENLVYAVGQKRCITIDRMQNRDLRLLIWESGRIDDQPDEEITGGDLRKSGEDLQHFTFKDRKVTHEIIVQGQHDRTCVYNLYKRDQIVQTYRLQLQ